MALEEGFRRIRFAGKGVLFTGLILVAVAVLFSLVSGLGRAEFTGFGFFAVIGIPISVVGAAILLGAWIAEGFASPRQPPRP